MKNLSVLASLLFLGSIQWHPVARRTESSGPLIHSSPERRGMKRKSFVFPLGRKIKRKGGRKL